MRQADTALRWDVVIVGGGPAGLSAGLLLARACRNVIIVDAGKQRNAMSRHVHGFLSRDGIAPRELLYIARDQLLSYPSVKLEVDEVLSCQKIQDGFALTTHSDRHLECSVLLLAQGVKDKLPAIQGIEPFYGSSVHHCPFCDGWEHRGQRLVVYGNNNASAELAHELLCWSRQVTLITDEAHEVSNETLTKLRHSGARTVHSRPMEVQQSANRMEALRCTDGAVIPCDALFFVSEEARPLELVRSLGCRIEKGCPAHGEDMQTSVHGVFVAGNACEGRDMVAMATAQGAMAAIGINDYLVKLGKFYVSSAESAIAS